MIEGYPNPCRYKVFIRCNTYNQSKYIIDCLNGFSIQQTNFPFLVSVIDDASKDGEQDILKEWFYENCASEDIAVYDNKIAYILMAPEKNNRNCVFALQLLKKNLFSKPEKQEIHKFWRSQCVYEAFCEGDDYWIDKDKLQMQVDLLEQNQDCALCYTAYNVVDEQGNPTHNRYRELKCYEGDVFDKLLQTNFIQFATVMTRCHMMDVIRDRIIERGVKNYDYTMFLELSLLGEFRFINKNTTCYRICTESSSHSKSLSKEIKFALDLHKVHNTYCAIKYGDISKLQKFYKKVRLVCIVSIKHYLKRIFKYNK